MVRLGYAGLMEASPGLCVLILLTPAAVGAQDGPADGTETLEDTGDDARAAFEAGSAAIDAGRYADGVEHLERSLELLPRVSTAYNLAVARRGTGDFVGARRALRGLLEGEYGEADAATRGRARQLLAEAEAEIATLRVAVDGGAPIRVTVDGVTVGVLDAPGQISIEVNPGTRLVGADAPDRQQVERPLSIAPGAVEVLTIHLASRLDERPGRLEIVSSDPTARVEVLGHASAIGRLSLDLPADEYVVRIIGAHGPREDRVQVPAGRRVRLELSPAMGGGDDAWIWALITAGIAAALGVGAWVGWEVYEPSPVASPDWMTIQL